MFPESQLPEVAALSFDWSSGETVAIPLTSIPTIECQELSGSVSAETVITVVPEFALTTYANTPVSGPS
jgi:hypothetical protein